MDMKTEVEEQVLGKMEDITFKIVPISRIKLEENATYNPNVMDKKTFDELKKNMDVYGYLAPCICIPEDENYFIIDGAHRILALKDKGYKMALIIVAENVTRAAAYAGAISFNKLRGSLSGPKLATMLAKGIQLYGTAEMIKYSSLDKTKLQEHAGPLMKEGVELATKEELAATVNLDDILTNEMKEINAKSVEDTESNFIFSYPKAEYDFIASVLDDVNKNHGKALLELCKFHTK